MANEEKLKINREAVNVFEALAPLKLLHPATQRAQLHRWQDMLSEIIHLLHLLSKSSTTPANAPAAAAELLAAARVQTAAGAGQLTGLLHGITLDDKSQPEVLRDLGCTMSRLLTQLQEEVGGWVVGLQHQVHSRLLMNGSNCHLV